MTPTSATWPLMDVENVICIDCDRDIPVGSPYASRLVAMKSDGDTLAEVTCVYCDLNGSPE